MISAIILAAGQSRRMGAQKLLLPFGGKTAIAHIAEQVLAGSVDRTIVVVSEDCGPVAAALSGKPVAFVTNSDPKGDMLSSVRRGLAAVPQKCQAVLVVLGDQPNITSLLIAQVVEAWRGRGAERTQGAIVVPACNGRRGHPILFSAGYRQEVLGGYDGVGLRGLLRAHDREVIEVPVVEELLLRDMDSPGDYQRELGKFQLPE